MPDDESPTDPPTSPDRDPAWPVAESVAEYETSWYTGGYDRVEQPDGTHKRYYWADLPPAVIIVAIDDDAVVFVEQYRPTVRRSFLELPAGIVEADESFLEAGARELREEVGLDPATVTTLQEYWVATGVLRHRRAIVYAEDFTTIDPDRDGNEFLTIRRVPVDDAIEQARAPPANDATISGLLITAAEGYLPSA
ncbi:MAG: NUDIX hydrolase [Halobacteriales archaeon]|nr:NUDIX hydrolase [Halobacteriales archaeon]